MNITLFITLAVDRSNLPVQNIYTSYLYQRKIVLINSFIFCFVYTSMRYFRQFFKCFSINHDIYNNISLVEIKIIFLDNLKFFLLNFISQLVETLT